MQVAITVSAFLVGVGTSVRWIRVAQREHYIPGSTTRFALRWWRARPMNVILGCTALVAAVISWGYWPAALVAIAVPAVGPVGLSLRGRSSALAWTRRLRLLSVVAGTLYFAACLLLLLAGDLVVGAIALAPMMVPLIIDAALAVLSPVEKSISERYVDRAARRLRDVDPCVIAVTGSYGKTTTKEYIKHLLGMSRSVLASPASFNNQAGLSRTVNELLTLGTDIFVAEVGTYKPGEIRKICHWLKPNIGIITAIGPVHLERMRTIETIVRAKAEILETVETAILNVDFPELDVLSAELPSSQRIVRCTATRAGCDVLVEPNGTKLVVVIRDDMQRVVEKGGIHPGNLACAVAAALEVGVTPEQIFGQLDTLPSPAHRQKIITTAQGVTIIDNTYNSNPEAAKSSLALLATYTEATRRIVVSPGIVELGKLQRSENEAFARTASKVATDFVLVGRTNRRHLMRGLEGGGARQHVVATRKDAVDWVRKTASVGDVVLYENDLPDHYS